jgi:large subunit ribosomal protein L25
MTQATTIAVEERQRAGKGAARKLRNDGLIPAVIYGAKEPPILISVASREFDKHYKKRGFFAQVFKVSVGGKTYEVLARDFQVEPVTDHPIHIDFMRFTEKTRLQVNVQVAFINEELSPGIKVGGVLNVVRRTIEMICQASNIPESLVVDLEGLEIGDSVHISAIDLPEGAKLVITDRDFTVATIAAPTLMVEEEVEEEDVEGEEGEEGLEEGEEGAEEGDAGADSES